VTQIVKAALQRWSRLFHHPAVLALVSADGGLRGRSHNIRDLAGQHAPFRSVSPSAILGPRYRGGPTRIGMVSDPMVTLPEQEIGMLITVQGGFLSGLQTVS